MPVKRRKLITVLLTMHGSDAVIITRVNSMAKTSAYQLQKTDIRINSICPGIIETGMTTGTFEYARQRGTTGKIGQLNPLGRYGLPEGERCLSIRSSLSQTEQRLHTSHYFLRQVSLVP